MAHIYEADVWKNSINKWHCSDIKDLGHGSGYWWIPCRILGISPCDFVLLLKEQFNVSEISYNIEANFLHYSWDKEIDAKKFKSYINKKAKEVRAIICV